MNKKDLRSKYKTLRQQLSAEAIEDKSLAIANRLLSLDIWEKTYFHLFLTIEEQKYIIGVQANLWSEYLTSPAKLNYMLYPRIFALDESGKFLVASNVLTGNVIVFKRDFKTGLLKKVGKQIKMENVSCVQIKRI